VILAEQKQQTIADSRRHERDSGSPEVQISILTQRIKEVASHLREHRQDHHTRRGLVMMVAKRNRLLRYLQRVDREAYLATIQRLGLRK